MVDGTDMEVPLYVLLLQAPALYRAMLNPSPGTLLELKVVLSRLKRMSARSSRFPNAFAHQAKDTPQPSQVPQLELALMVHVSSAAAKPLKAAASRSPLCMVIDRAKIVGASSIPGSNCTSTCCLISVLPWSSGEAGSEPLVGREEVKRLVSGRMQQCRLQTNGKPFGSGLVGMNGTLEEVASLKCQQLPC